MRGRPSLFNLFLPVIALAPLVGCATGSPLPGTVPDDALSSMYTTTPALQVATCIAQVIGGTVQNEGAGYVLTGRAGTRYNAGPNDSKSVYPVQVVVRGITVPAQESERVAQCLRPTGAAT